MAAEGPIWVEDRAGETTVHLYLFWSKYCPHCQEALPFVRGLAGQFPWLELHPLEVTGSVENRDLYREFAASFGQEASSVPAFFFCGTMMVGYDSPAGMGAQLAERLKGCHARALSGQQPGPAVSPILPLETERLSALSLPALTVAIAGLDAFNPCAFFVLLFLLSLLVHAGGRRRMLLIGGVFVFFSGLIYFLFMAAWLNVFLLFGQIRLVTFLAGAVAVAMALLNIKDFVRPGVGPSLSIADENKPGLYKRVRGLLHTQNLPALLAGTVTLAVAANSYELLCTSGLPMLYTRILTLKALAPSAYYGYLVLYNVVYVIPLAIIVGLFTWSLGSRKLQPREGQILKLVSGLMMLGLGAVLLTDPTRLEDPWVGGGIVAGALLIGLAAWRRGRQVV